MSIENVTSSRVQQALNALTVFQLSYMLSKVLNHWYDYGGFSAGRSYRAVLLDLFMSVNHKLNTLAFDVFPHVDLAKARAQYLIEQKAASILQGKTHMRNRKVLSAVLLHKLMKHYLEEIQKNAELEAQLGKSAGVSHNDVNYSFKCHFPLFKLLHDLYMQGVGLSPEKLQKFAQRHDDERIRRLIEWTPEQLRN